MKADDDAFVNMFSLIARLDEFTAATLPSSSASNMLILCNVWRNDSVNYNYSTKSF